MTLGHWDLIKSDYMSLLFLDIFIFGKFLYYFLYYQQIKHYDYFFS